MRKTGTMLALAGIAMVAVLAWGLPPRVEAERGAQLGQPAPEITGSPWINGEPQSLARLRGRVVYVEFWTYG